MIRIGNALCTCLGGWPGLSPLFFFPVPELWVPRPCAFGKGGYDAADIMGLVMPSGLHRTYGAHHLHFNTGSCYRRLPFLRTAQDGDFVLNAGRVVGPFAASSIDSRPSQSARRTGHPQCGGVGQIKSLGHPPRRPPSPLDFYLSWMSPYFLSDFRLPHV